MAQGVRETVDALFAALQGLFPDTDPENPALVCFGAPGEYQPDLIVGVMDVRAPITRPTAGTNRSRDKRIEIDLIISAYRHGGPEVQRDASTAAWTAAASIETYLRTSPNERLGGACYDSFLEVTNFVPDEAFESADGVGDPVSVGRVATITATVQARIRI